MIKKMNHVEYPKSLIGKSNDELRFIIKDAKEAMEAMPDNPNNSYYADEVCYCVDQLRARGNFLKALDRAVKKTT